ncbi:MAG: 50S ribosomal protein L14e [Candidatus Ranarchaeia archaeon]
MAIYTIGRVCEKTRGRDAPNMCVIVDVIDKNYVLVTGPKKLTGVRRRKVNVSHLTPLPHVLEIKKGADDKTIEPLMQTILKTDV